MLLVLNPVEENKLCSWRARQRIVHIVSPRTPMLQQSGGHGAFFESPRRPAPGGAPPDPSARWDALVRAARRAGVVVADERRRTRGLRARRPGGGDVAGPVAADVARPAAHARGVGFGVDGAYASWLVASFPIAFDRLTHARVAWLFVVHRGQDSGARADRGAKRQPTPTPPALLLTLMVVRGLFMLFFCPSIPCSWTSARPWSTRSDASRSPRTPRRDGGPGLAVVEQGLGDRHPAARLTTLLSSRAAAAVDDGGQRGAVVRGRSSGAHAKGGAHGACEAPRRPGPRSALAGACRVTVVAIHASISTKRRSRTRGTRSRDRPYEKRGRRRPPRRVPGGRRHGGRESHRGGHRELVAAIVCEKLPEKDPPRSSRSRARSSRYAAYAVSEPVGRVFGRAVRRRAAAARIATLAGPGAAGGDDKPARLVYYHDPILQQLWRPFTTMTETRRSFKKSSFKKRKEEPSPPRWGGRRGGRPRAGRRGGRDEARRRRRRAGGGAAPQ